VFEGGDGDLVWIEAKMKEWFEVPILGRIVLMMKYFGFHEGTGGLVKNGGRDLEDGDEELFG
jgi:hypothetical protein